MDIEIIVDELVVEVDQAEYIADPEAVVNRVREARIEIVGDLTGVHDISPDYNELVNAFGEVE